MLSSYQARRATNDRGSCYTCGVVYLGRRTLPPHKCDGCPTALWAGEGATIAPREGKSQFGSYNISYVNQVEHGDRTPARFRFSSGGFCPAR